MIDHGHSSLYLIFDKSIIGVFSWVLMGQHVVEAAEDLLSESELQLLM